MHSVPFPLAGGDEPEFVEHVERYRHPLANRRGQVIVADHHGATDDHS